MYLTGYLGVGMSSGNAVEDRLEYSIGSGLNVVTGLLLIIHPRYDSDSRLSFGLDGSATFDLVERSVREPFTGQFHQNLFSLFPYIQLGNAARGLYSQIGFGMNISRWESDLMDVGENRHLDTWQPGPMFSLAGGIRNLFIRFQVYFSRAEVVYRRSGVPGSHEDRTPWTAHTRVLTVNLRF
jgi:hypothetical protein